MNFRENEEIDAVLKKQNELKCLHRYYITRKVEAKKSVDLKKKALAAEIEEKYGEFKGFTDYDLGRMEGISNALKWVRREEIYEEL
jgi:hypothetical protein